MRKKSNVTSLPLPRSSLATSSTNVRGSSSIAKEWQCVLEKQSVRFSYHPLPSHAGLCIDLQRRCDVFKGRRVCKSVFSTFLLPWQPRMSLLDMHPQVQRAQVCNKFRRFFLLEVPPEGPPLHSGGPQKLNLFRAGWSLPQKSVPAALLSFAGLHVGTTILTPRIRVVLSTDNHAAAC